MGRGVKLEICCNSIEAALIAEQAGANRVEFCINLEAGGTTPSRDEIKSIKQQLTIPVHIMVCPRGEPYMYNEDEVRVIIHDIEYCASAGVDGVVIGGLRHDNTIDTVALAQWVKAAQGMSVTFHRAFDQCAIPADALDILIAQGVNRVLTSGGLTTAVEGKDTLRALIQKGGGQITIMPGGGVRTQNVKEIITYTGATEVHSAAGVLNNLVDFKNEVLRLRRVIDSL